MYHPLSSHVIWLHGRIILCYIVLPFFLSYVYHHSVSVYHWCTINFCFPLVLVSIYRNNSVLFYISFLASSPGAGRPLPAFQCNMLHAEKLGVARTQHCMSKQKIIRVHKGQLSKRPEAGNRRATDLLSVLCIEDHWIIVPTKTKAAPWTIEI